MVKIDVLAGNDRRLVGTMGVRVGLKTSRGTVTKVNAGSFNTENETVRNDRSHNTTVRISDARRCGYPDSDDCIEYVRVEKRRKMPSFA